MTTNPKRVPLAKTINICYTRAARLLQWKEGSTIENDMEGLIRETSLDGLSAVTYDGACSVEVVEYKTVATDGIHWRCHIRPGTRVI